MKILYVHGLLGSTNGSAVQLLKKSFSNDEIVAVEYDNYDCKKGYKDITDFYLANPDIDIVIGCSLGGFYAQFLCNRPKILINPAFNGGDDVTKYVADSLDKLSPTFVSDLNDIRDDYLKNYYDYEDYCETTTIFCENDDVITFDNDRLELYNNIYKTKDIIVTDKGKHRLSEDIIPIISEIIEKVRK